MFNNTLRGPLRGRLRLRLKDQMESIDPQADKAATPGQSLAFKPFEEGTAGC